MMVGCYTLELYCDKEGFYNKYDADGTLRDEVGHTYQEFPHEYMNELGSKCRSRARKAGWKLGKKQLCPKCSGKKN